MQYNPFYYLESTLKIVVVVGCVVSFIIFLTLFGYYIVYRPVTNSALNWVVEQVFGGVR